MLKRLSILVFVVCMTLAGSASAAERFAFGVKPGTVTPQAAYFGYALSQNLVLLGGVQFIMGGLVKRQLK